MPWEKWYYCYRQKSAQRTGGIVGRGNEKMSRKVLAGLLLAGALAIALSGCRSASKIEYSDTDAAKAALDQAQTIYIEGNYETPNQKADILADGKVAGYLKESGIFGTQKWTVTVDGETWFSIRFVTDEWINEDGEDYGAGNTYGYYDADGNCLGYAQSRGVKQDDEYTDHYYFMDADGNLKDYCMEENGYYAWDSKGNVIATGDWDPDFRVSFMGDSCHVQIDTAEDASTQMDFMDKMVMYLRLFREAEFWLGD